MKAAKAFFQNLSALDCTEWLLFMFECQIENHFLFNCLQASMGKVIHFHPA